MPNLTSNLTSFKLPIIFSTVILEYIDTKLGIMYVLILLFALQYVCAERLTASV